MALFDNEQQPAVVGLTRARAPIAETLAEASWAEADRLAAQAWRDSHWLDDLLVSAAQSCAKATPQRLVRRLEAASAEALLLRQSLNSVASLRGFRLFGSDEIIEYDPARHEPEARTPRATERVRVVRQGVERRVGGAFVVIVRAVVKIVGR